jgi:hypothetical protein
VRLWVRPALTLDAGWDDNLFLDPTLTSATPPRSDAVIDVRPALSAGLLARGHALVLDADYVERITPSNGDLRDLFLRLGWISPAWRRTRLSLAGLYEHYETSLYPDNTFDLGGVEAGLRVNLQPAELAASYRFDGRAYPDASRNGQLDLEHWVAATVDVRLHAMVSLDAGYRFLAVRSNEPTAELDRHRGELGFEVRPHARVRIDATYALWWQSLPHGAMPMGMGMGAIGGPRTDLAHALTAALRVSPIPWLELFARYDLIYSTSDSQPGRYQLNQIVAGIAASWTFAREHARPPPPLGPTIEGSAVTFRARARPGAAVAIVGDWNGWQPQPLASAGGDLYAGTYTLPPGRHAYALSVDGVIRVAPYAMSYADDGFGGRNAVVDVP